MRLLELRFRRTIWLIVKGALSAALLLLVLGSGVASAATFSFGFTGAEQAFTVPAGVHLLHVTATGAEGGLGGHDGVNLGGLAGFGDQVQADLSVVPGEVLYVDVGGSGAAGSLGGAGGFNGGGSSNGGAFSVFGAGGGGASDIRTCSLLAPSCTGTPSSLASRLLVAGGGGGGSTDGRAHQTTGGAGGNAGQSGQAGQSAGCGATVPGGGGGAGSQLAGGLGGTAGSDSPPAGNPGTLGQGGAAGTGGLNSEPGGGGGGGYFGGGAGGSGNGCAGGGGGGGSSFASPTAASKVAINANTTGSSGVVFETPSNAFTFGKTKDNKKKGTALITVDVPGPGTIDLSGKGVQHQRARLAGEAIASKAVGKAGAVKLLVKPKGKTKKKLNKTGKAKVKISVTFAPTGGVPATLTKSVKLVKKH